MSNNNTPPLYPAPPVDEEQNRDVPFVPPPGVPRQAGNKAPSLYPVPVPPERKLLDEMGDAAAAGVAYIITFAVVVASPVTLIVLGVFFKEMRDNMNELIEKVNELHEAVVR